MECDAIGPDLSAFADGELEPSVRSRVEAHLAACPGCRRSLEVWRAAGAALRRGDRTPLPSFRATRRPRPKAFPLRWLVPAAAALLVAAALSFDRVRAAREAGLLVELEGKNRAETARLLGGLESLRYEIASLALRARAGGSGEAARLASDLRPLVDELKRLGEHLRRIQTDLEREGLLVEAKEPNDAPESR